MWKVAALFAGTVGFLLGSWSGRGPYEQVGAWSRKLTGRPPVRRVTEHVSDAVSQVGDAASETASAGAARAADVAVETIDTGADRATGKISEIKDKIDP
ncbi:MAG: hypothetical protein ACRDY2_04310 [Acidimicrobiales bacterium]